LGLERCLAETPRSPHTGQALGNLGRVYVMQGKYTDALKTLQQAMEIFRCHCDYGESHETVGDMLNMLGGVYCTWGCN
jgi:hypothetical protein